jgi:hypothetical protein
MSDLELQFYINKRRKRRRIILTELYFESILLGVAYLTSQRLPKDVGCFSDDEHRHNHRKYLLKEMYDGSEGTCYDELRLTKRNFRCDLHDSVYVSVEEKVAMFLLVVGHGIKMRLLRGTYKRSLETISRHFADVLTAILSLTGEFIKLPEHFVQPPNDYKWKWFGNALGVLDGCHVEVCVDVADQGRYRTESNKSALTCLELLIGT